MSRRSLGFSLSLLGAALAAAAPAEYVIRRREDSFPSVTVAFDTPPRPTHHRKPKRSNHKSNQRKGKKR